MIFTCKSILVRDSLADTIRIRSGLYASEERSRSGYWRQGEYIQKVAAYLDNKLDEHKKMESYNRLPLEFQNIMIQLNIADEFFKAKNMADTLKGDLESKDKEIYDLKHELITLQAKADKQAEEIAQLKKDAQDYESMIIGLEAQKDTKKQ